MPRKYETKSDRDRKKQKKAVAQGWGGHRVQGSSGKIGEGKGGTGAAQGIQGQTGWMVGERVKGSGGRGGGKGGTGNGGASAAQENKGVKGGAAGAKVKGVEGMEKGKKGKANGGGKLNGKEAEGKCHEGEDIGRTRAAQEHKGQKRAAWGTQVKGMGSSGGKGGGKGEKGIGGEVNTKEGVNEEASAVRSGGGQATGSQGGGEANEQGKGNGKQAEGGKGAKVAGKGEGSDISGHKKLKRWLREEYLWTPKVFVKNPSGPAGVCEAAAVFNMGGSDPKWFIICWCPRESLSLSLSRALSLSFFKDAQN